MNENRRWSISFIHDPTGIITYIDYNVSDEYVCEHGAENAIGILEANAFHTGEISQLSIPELEQLADKAAATPRSDRQARRLAWQAVEEKVWQVKCQMLAGARKAELEAEAQERGYKPGWVFFRIKDEFGYNVAQAICPR
jgi:hypothetical protein